MNGKPTAHRKDRGTTSRRKLRERRLESLQHERLNLRRIKAHRPEPPVTALSHVMFLLIELADNLASLQIIDKATNSLINAVRKRRRKMK